MVRSKLFYILLALLLALSLFGCGNKMASENTDPAWGMEYPGLTWGMTPEEVCGALSLSDTDYEISIGSFYTIHGIRMSAFDVDNAHLALSFQDSNGDGVYSLFLVSVSYPQDADMETVKAAIVQRYGEPVEAVTTHITWDSTALYQDIMSEEEAAFLSEYSETTKESLTKPVTQITWDTKCYPSFTLDGAESGNRVELNSGIGFFTREGGYTEVMKTAN